MPDIFSTTDYEGKTVNCTKHQWYSHIVSKHQIMNKNVSAVQETIHTPDKVYRSVDYDNRKVFFKSTETATFGPKLLTKVIVQYDDLEQGEVVTAFPVKKEKGGIGDVEYPK